MSDTTFRGRTILTGKSKAMLLYVITAVALTAGQTMFSLDQKEWDSWWWMKKLGWGILLIGSISNTMKAFYSKSSEAV